MAPSPVKRPRLRITKAETQGFPTSYLRASSDTIEHGPESCEVVGYGEAKTSMRLWILTAVSPGTYHDPTPAECVQLAKSPRPWRRHNHGVVREHMTTARCSEPLRENARGGVLLLLLSCYCGGGGRPPSRCGSLLVCSTATANATAAVSNVVVVVGFRALPRFFAGASL